MSHHEAIVVGGGPAGAVAAVLLSRRGWRTTIVESKPRGRDKCCGDCLHPRAVTGLRRLGLLPAAPKQAPPTRIGEAWQVGERGSRLLHRQPLAEGGIALSRRILDAALLEAAEREGVVVEHGRAARWSAAGLTVDGHPRSAALVVAADGLGSAVARAAGLALAPSAPAPGSVARTRGKFGFALDLPGLSESAWPGDAIVMLVAPGGYLGVVRGVSRAQSTLHIAGCCRPSRSGGAAAIPGEPRACVRWFAARHTQLAEAMERSSLDVAKICGAGPMPWRTRARTAEGIALIGDAAGYAEPFTGEGIAWAIESAVLLAAAADRPGVWGLRERERYETSWRSNIQRAHRRCGFVAGLLGRPALVRFAGSLARAAPTWAGPAVRRLVSR